MKKLDIPKAVRLFLIFVIMISSCTKERVEKCQGNCATITIIGQVWDSSNRKGLSNIPIKVFWEDAGICYICPETVVGIAKSDASGNFNFRISIDTSKFHGNNLHVQVPIPSGYISNLIDDDHCEETFNQFTPILQNIKFIVYQKTNLQIKLVRTQNDNFTAFDLRYRFAFTSYGTYWYAGSPPLPIDSFNVITAAKVYTKVTWIKYYGVPQTVNFTDSIKCDINNPNIIVLNY